MASSVHESRLRLTATAETEAAARKAAADLDLVSRAARRLHGEMSMSARGASAIGRQFAASAAAAFSLDTVRDSVKEYAAMERRFTRIGINAEVSSGAINKNRALIFKMAQETAQPLDDMVAGFEEIVRATGNLKQAEDLFPSVARASQALGASVKDTALTAQVMNDTFKISRRDIPDAFDAIAKAGNSGKFEARDLATYMSQLAPIMTSIGYKGLPGLQKTLAILETIRDQTGTAEEAFTALRDVTTRLATPEMENNFTKQGINLRAALDAARRSGGDLLATFQNVTKETLKQMGYYRNIPAEARESILASLFPEKDSRAAMLAMLQLNNRLVDLIDNVKKNSAGAIDEANRRILDDAQSNIQRLENEWSMFKLQLGATTYDLGGKLGINQAREDLQMLIDLLKVLQAAKEKIAPALPDMSMDDILPPALNPLGPARKIWKLAKTPEQFGPFQPGKEPLSYLKEQFGPFKPGAAMPPAEPVIPSLRKDGRSPTPGNPFEGLIHKSSYEGPPPAAEDGAWSDIGQGVDETAKSTGEQVDQQRKTNELLYQMNLKSDLVLDRGRREGGGPGGGMGGGFGGSGSGGGGSGGSGSGGGAGGGGGGAGPASPGGGGPDTRTPLEKAGIAGNKGGVESGLDAFNIYGAKKRGDGIRPIDPNAFQPAPGSGDGSGAKSLTELTEQEAKRAGIDPRIMHGIRAGESGHRKNNDPRGAYDIGDGGSSFGPWQLHYGGINPKMPKAGLGEDFDRWMEKQHPGQKFFQAARDPKTLPQQTRFVAEWLKHRSPVGTWFGYHGNRNADPSWGDSGYKPAAGAGGAAAPGPFGLGGFNAPPVPQAPEGGSAQPWQPSGPATNAPRLVRDDEGHWKDGANLFSSGQRPGHVGGDLVTIKTMGGKTVTVNKDAAASFKALTDDLEKSGYKINTIGGYSPRAKRGGHGWSEHAFGNAIDINERVNPMDGSRRTDMPPDILERARKHGLSWGGSKDPMHFEWRGKPHEEQPQQPAPPAAPPPPVPQAAAPPPPDLSQHHAALDELHRKAAKPIVVRFAKHDDDGPHSALASRLKLARDHREAKARAYSDVGVA